MNKENHSLSIAFGNVVMPIKIAATEWWRIIYKGLEEFKILIKWSSAHARVCLCMYVVDVENINNVKL
jgi:hypothetical protein